jgi:hypothetical protein
MSVKEHILDHNIVFLQQMSHLYRTRMQEIANKGEIIEGIAENINHHIDVFYLSQLVNRLSYY